MKYVKKATTWIEATYREKDVFENTKTYQDNEEINIGNSAYGTSFLQQGFMHSSFNADTTRLTGTLANPGKVVTSETGELKWDGNLGVFTVNSPFWQGATGYLGSKTIDLKNITISEITTTDNLNFAAVHLISLDSLPIGQSKRMILLTSARLENEGLKWNSTQTSLVSAGGTKALCEPVQLKVKFKNASSDSVSVFMLNPTGLRTDSLLIGQSAADAVFSVNKKTLWYEINNHKKKLVTGNKKGLGNLDNSYMKTAPNPGRDYSTVEFSFSGYDTARFVLYNSFGKMILNEEILLTSNQVQLKQLDVSQLCDGIYFYGFMFENGTRVIDKLVVSK
jgi:hypothetical protein